MPVKKPFANFTPVRWRGTTYPTNIEREGLQQVVALSFDTPTGVLHVLLDEMTADEVGHACSYFRRAQSLSLAEMPPLGGQPKGSPTS